MIQSRLTRISQYVRNTRVGAAIASLLVVGVFASVPYYLAVHHRDEQQKSLKLEAERHVASRIGQAQALLDRAKSIPEIVGLSIAQGGSATAFESAVRNVLAMSGIVESVSVATIRGPAATVQRNAKEQTTEVSPPWRAAGPLQLEKKLFVGFGDGTLLIRDALLEKRQESVRFWGYLTAEASFADLIQELQLLSLVNAGFGVKFSVQWQAGAGESVIFRGGNYDAPATARSIPLAGNAVLSLAVSPPVAPLFALDPASLAGLAAAAILMFALTYHLLRRPAVLERKVVARTREIAEEKAALKREIAARTTAESYLERSYALLDSIFEHIPGMIVLKRVSDGRIARINSSGEQLLGRSRDLICGRSNEEIFSPAIADALTRGDAQALTGRSLVQLPLMRVEMPAATPRWIAFSKTVLRERSGEAQYILEFGEDLTERKQAEERVESLNRVLTVLGEINQLIIYTRDRNGLLAEARRILQEKGRFSAVWIRLNDGGETTLLAEDGMREYVERIHGELQNPRRRCWPERRLHCQSMACCNAKLTTELRQNGLESLLQLPLRYGDMEWGDIGILGAVGQRFSDEEQSLLEELAGNLSFALDALRQEELRRLAESKLALSARVFESSSEGIVITDAALRIVMVNRAFSTVTGYSAEEVIGNTPGMLASSRQSKGHFRALWRELQKTGEWHGEVINRRKNGEDFPEWLSVSQVRDDAGSITHYVAVFADLTARRRNEERIKFLANYDSLTSLPNRDHFTARLADAVEDARAHDRRIAVVYLDLDRFKLINETVGHASADLLLVEVASRLLGEARSKLDVARFGGDQFALLIPNVESVGQATHTVQRIQERLRAPFRMIAGQELHVSASIGVSVYPDDGLDGGTLSQAADSAMYKAIEEGGNAYRFFHQEMNERAAERVQIESRLHHALDRGEFAVFLQPFVATSSGRVVGAEALLRWKCPELGGYINPATFIPLLEETGLIRDVGDWVLDRACAEAARWRAMTGESLFVAVNISALQLEDALPEKVARAIAAHQLTPDQLEIELTESAIMRDADHGIRILHELKALGVRLSIDDFGTGYSSLSYLKRLPMSTLKIDRSFVMDIPGDNEAISIARAILALGHSLHLDIIAEGVESEEQVEFLCHNGCDLLQGYHFSKPLNADSFVELLIEKPEFKLPAASPRVLQLATNRRLRG